MWFENLLSKHLFSPIFQVHPFSLFVLGMLDSSCWHVSGDRIVEGCFKGMLDLGGFFPGLIGSCAFCLLPVWYYGMVLIPLSFLLLLLSTCSMARGQEETSTSQAGSRRGPSRDTPFASSLISSLSMEELRSYCQIPNSIDFELLDSPAEPSIDEEGGVVNFTQEQLAAGLRFHISSLVKQFLHFSGASPALIHPNVIWILIGCSVLNLLYQLDISLVEVCFIYTLKLGHGGRLSMSAHSLRLQFDLPLRSTIHKPDLSGSMVR